MAEEMSERSPQKDKSKAEDFVKPIKSSIKMKGIQPFTAND